MKCTKASDSSAGPGSIWLNRRSRENEPARTRLGGSLTGCGGTRSILIPILAPSGPFRRKSLSAGGTGAAAPAQRAHEIHEGVGLRRGLSARAQVRKRHPGYAMPAAIAGRQAILLPHGPRHRKENSRAVGRDPEAAGGWRVACLLYTSDAADDLLCVDLGGRRI